MRTNYQSPEELQLLRGFLLTEKKLLLCLTSPYQSRELISSSSYPTLEFIPRINYLAGIEKFEERVAPERAVLEVESAEIAPVEVR